MVPSKNTARPAAKAGKYLTFQLGQEEFGLEILKVVEIIGLQKITPIPHAPDYFAGVINLRGTIHPVIDLNRKFDLGQTEFGDRTCIIVVMIRSDEIEGQMGLLIDAVADVIDIGDKEIEDAPNLGTVFCGDFILGMAKKDPAVITLLNIDRVLSQDEMSKISDLVSETDSHE